MKIVCVHVSSPHTILPLFILYSGYQREVLNVRHFLPSDGQSSPCLQPLSSHFTHSTRWKPRKLSSPISPFASNTAATPRIVYGNDSRGGDTQTNTWQHTQTFVSLQLHTDMFTETQTHLLLLSKTPVIFKLRHYIHQNIPNTV